MRRTPAAVAVAAALLLGACSSKTPTPEPAAPAATTPAATTSAQTASPATPAEPSAHGGLAECLKSHGVADSGGMAVVLGPPPGVDPAVWDAAMKECSALAPGPATP